MKKNSGETSREWIGWMEGSAGEHYCEGLVNPRSWILGFFDASTVVLSNPDTIS